MLVIAASARVSPLADVEDSTRGSRIQIGEETVVDSFVKIKPTGGSADVLIGARCAINAGVVIYSGNGVTIGDGGPNCGELHACAGESRICKTRPSDSRPGLPGISRRSTH